MSEYRDDIQETAVAGDGTWLKISGLVEESARSASAILFGLMVAHADMAAASDEVIDRARHVFAEQAVASNEVTGLLRASVLVSERRRVTERLSHSVLVTHEDSAAAQDQVTDSVSAVIVERATLTEDWASLRRVATLTTESAIVGDFAGQFAAGDVEDTAQAADTVIDKARARVLVADAASLSDELIEVARTISPVLVESASASDSVTDALHASALVVEGAVIEDAMPLERGRGQAWTANVDNWAMSRYEPMAYSALAVIDGKLYAMADDGVYLLGAGAETIAGQITTGKVDVSGGALAHPNYAYLEYELADAGVAVMDVTTAQSGRAETYAYPLAAEPAGELTNGRFIFGRGLKGRHFTFSLRITAEHAHINDLSVSTAQSKRRV